MMKPLDLQVNGYAGTDFNRDGLTAEALHHACTCLLEDGCDSILATFITDDLDAMSRRMARLVELRAQDSLAQEVIAGIHIEGPFINPEKGYVGAHPPQHVKPAGIEDAKRLLDAAGGRCGGAAASIGRHGRDPSIYRGDGSDIRPTVKESTRRPAAGRKVCREPGIRPRSDPPA
mgnify:CR=1 FL=1